MFLSLSVFFLSLYIIYFLFYQYISHPYKEKSIKVSIHALNPVTVSIYTARKNRCNTGYEKRNIVLGCDSKVLTLMHAVSRV